LYRRRYDILDLTKELVQKVKQGALRREDGDAAAAAVRLPHRRSPVTDVQRCKSCES
jgi:hypothetical protein